MQFDLQVTRWVIAFVVEEEGGWRDNRLQWKESKREESHVTWKILQVKKLCSKEVGVCILLGQ